MGQRKFSILRRLINYSVKQTSLYGVIAYGSLILIIDKIMLLFMSNPMTIEMARFFYITVGLSTLFSNYPLQMSMFFTAINRPLESAAISVFRTLVLIPVLTYFFIASYGAIGVAFGYILSDVIMIIGIKIFMRQVDLSTLKVYE